MRSPAVLLALLGEAAAFGSSGPPAVVCPTCDICDPAPAPGPFAGKKTALIQVDVQKCFTNGPPVGQDENDLDYDDYAFCNPPSTGGTDTCTRLGSLGVASGQGIVPKLNDLRHSCLFDGVFRSQDYHPPNHISFSSRHFGTAPGAGKVDGSGFSYDGGPIPYVGYAIDLHCTVDPNEDILKADCCLVDVDQPACTPDPATGVNVCTADSDTTNPACACSPTDDGGEGECTRMTQGMWTDHCLQEGDSGFATGLEVSVDDIVMRKGTTANMDAYSIFKDNAKIHSTTMHTILQAEGFDTLVFTGIATDFCVYWSATDAVELGYDVYVVTDASAPIEVPVNVTAGTTSLTLAMADMEAKGVKFITTDELLDIDTCPDRRSLAEWRKKGGAHSQRRHLVEKYGKTIKLW